MSFKNFFKRKTVINSKTIHENFNFMDKESCRSFLTSLFVSGKKVEYITLGNGQQVRMEDIPDDQIIIGAKQ